MNKADFVEAPRRFLRHTAKRSFIGPGLCLLHSGRILMAAPWGRPPANFEQLAATEPVPMLYESNDGGRVWRETGRMNMGWGPTGMISDGGITLLRLQDGRLAFLGHRHVAGLHGGGTPVFSTSHDEGRSWEAARVLMEEDRVCYVMNDRMIQLRGGRLLVPVSLADSELGGTYREGARSVGRCFLSDDSGESWRLSRGSVELPKDERGVAEPCVAETQAGQLLMLCRTGAGSLHASWSADDGETWTDPTSTSLTSACAPFTLRSLAEGRLIVVYNHARPLYPGAFFPRNPLVFSTSEDHGKTWEEPIQIDDEGSEPIPGSHLQHIYPGLCQTSEGIVVVYSTHIADPEGRFGSAGEEGWRIGGGKRCILRDLPFPAAGR